MILSISQRLGTAYTSPRNAVDAVEVGPDCWNLMVKMPAYRQSFARPPVYSLTR